MRIFPTAPTISDEDGFTPQQDIFRRKSFGDGLINLVEMADDPLVVVLDAPWGTGKTTFIKMFAGELRKRRFPVIYFDAFENDYVDNGFLAIAGEVLRVSSQLKKDQTPAHKKFLKAAARTGGVLLRMGAKVGVKAATLGAIDATDLDALKSVSNDVAKEASTKADEYVESLLKIQSQESETIASIRSALSNLAEALSDEGNKKPLVFVVDELDRCRPTFALELLERIKHIFSIENVHFIFATHLEQLENSVRYSYGNDIDAKTYLQKFYNILLNLPDSEHEEYRNNTTIYISKYHESFL